MMQNIKKIAVFVLLLMSVGIDTVSAVTFGHNNKHNIPSSPPSDPEVTPPTIGFTETITAGNKKTTYQCKYFTHTSTDVKTSINIYDTKYKGNKNSLIPNSFNFPTDYSALAGTAIGVSMLDIRWVKWEVKKEEVWVSEVIETTVKEWRSKVTGYNCKYKSVGKPPSNGDNFFYERINSTEDFSVSKLNNTANDVTPTPILVIIPCVDENKTVSKIEDCRKDVAPWCQYDGYEEIRKYWQETKTYTTNVERSTNETQLQKCRTIAVNDAIGTDKNKSNWGYSGNGKLTWGAAYTIDLTNSNDVNGEHVRITADDVGGISTWKCYDADDRKLSACKFDREADYVSEMIEKLKTGDVMDNIWAHREYKKDKACIDVVTGMVSYVPSTTKNGTKKTKCDEDREFAIENDVAADGNSYWHYFIPLNAKSTEGVIIDTMMDWQGTIDENTCKKYLESYAADKDDLDKVKYTDIVVVYNKANGVVSDFSGDFYGDNKDSSSDWMLLDSMNGTGNEEYACRKTTKIEIPTKQGFYKETIELDETTGEDKSRFNGFNFYYKPIDITKEKSEDIIFPNGFAAGIKTLWGNWYNAIKNPSSSPENKKPDLSKSFDVLSYVASDINVKDVREYNKLNSYTSWQKMNLDGTSQYIDAKDSKLVIARAGDSGNVYKLGCGPLNINKYLDESETKINPLYQAGCSK